MQFFNHGGNGYIWEPLYRLRVSLTRCEQAAPVFTLVAHHCPTDRGLRLAALLHDVVHAPFSHSVERALGLDHHLLMKQVIGDFGLGDFLAHCGFDPEEIVGLIEGAPANPLVNGGEGMSLDHLDSWLRDSQTCGFGEIPAHLLLERLRLNGNVVEAVDEEAAWDLVRRMTTDHALFLQPEALGLDALAGEIIRRAGLSGTEMLQFGDAQALERASGLALVEILRERPWSLSVRPDDGGDGVLVTVKRLYLSQPWMAGRPVGEVLPAAAVMFEALGELRRGYRATWPK
jgi:HD superfamily phosphohydrolase